MSNNFITEKTLGTGAFGKVYLVQRIDDEKKFAMKVIDLRTSPTEEKELAVREAKLLKELKHDYVLRYIESFEKDGALCIVTEFCANGDLSEYLERCTGKKKLEENQLIEWFQQIASALQYLHSKQIVHRDVKTPNIFLTETWTTKLGDMGLAKVLDRPNSKAVTFCGSPYYMSPEIFSCKPYDSKSDIWALAVIVYEMATLERPFDAMLMHQLVFKIVHGSLPNMPTGYSPHLVSLLTSMMSKDPNDRPSAKDILNHQYFKDATPPVPLTSRKEEDFQVPGKTRYGIEKPSPTKKKVHREGDTFDMNSLLDTLTTLQSKDSGCCLKMPLRGLETIVASKTENRKKKYEKTLKPLPKSNYVRQSFCTESDHLDETVIAEGNLSTTVSEVRIDFEATLKDIQSQTATNAFNVMQMIVRTMTGILPSENNGAQEWMGCSKDPQAVMLRQIEHLQYYCTKVLGGDVELLQKVYDKMEHIKDENKLEDQLIKILGPEKFELCGVQLMFLKNFEYNIAKLNQKT